MQLNKKLSAFTVLEVMVGMVLTSIVVAMTYFAFHMLEYRAYTYAQSTAQTSDYLLLEKALRNDIGKASSILDSADNCLVLHFKNQPAVQYFFSPLQVIRIFENAKDSIHVSAQMINIRHSKWVTKLVTEVHFSLKTRQEIIPLTFTKLYTVSELMEAEQ